jgi:septal ring factor EnvC (AmiA/AmiB activator)
MRAAKDTYSNYGLDDDDFVRISSSHIGSNSNVVTDELNQAVKQMTLNTTAIEKVISGMNLDLSLEKLYHSSVSLKSQVLDMNQTWVHQSDMLDSNLHSIRQHLSTLNQEVFRLSKTLENQVKNERLDWAFSNIEKISDVLGWQDDEDNQGFYRRNSHQLTKKILLAFRQGEGYDLSYLRDTEHLNEDRRKIRYAAICERIHQLLGNRPRISMSDGRYTIYYS